MQKLAKYNMRTIKSLYPYLKMSNSVSSNCQPCFRIDLRLEPDYGEERTVFCRLCKESFAADPSYSFKGNKIISCDACEWGKTFSISYSYFNCCIKLGIKNAIIHRLSTVQSLEARYGNVETVRLLVDNVRYIRK